MNVISEVKGLLRRLANVISTDGLLAILNGTTKTLFTRLEVDSNGNLLIKQSEKAPGAPTVALADAGTSDLTAGDYRYLITFVTAAGET